MTDGELTLETLREQAAAYVEQLRGALEASGALVAAEVIASPPPFPEGVKALAWSLTPALTRRAREAAGLGPEHVIHATDGRIVLAVPEDKRPAVMQSLRGDARRILDATGDAVVVDVAWRELPDGALKATGDESAVAVLEALLEQDLPRARLRRSEGAPNTFWTPDEPSPAGLQELLAALEMPFTQPEDARLSRADAPDAAIAVARLDFDAVGRALRAVAEGKPALEGLRDRFTLLAALQLARKKAAQGLAAAGGDAASLIALPASDLLLLGAWPEILGQALAVRDAVVPYLAEIARGLGGERAARFVDLSAGVAVGAPGSSLDTLCERAEAELRRAKGSRRTRQGDRRKAALSVRGTAIGWEDLRHALAVGRDLGDAIAAGQAPRGLLRRLSVLHALWRRAEDALDGGAPRAAAAASQRQWLWAWQLGKAGGKRDEGAEIVKRLAKLALENVDDGATGAMRRTEQDAAAWLGLSAEIAAERAGTRREERG